MHATESTSRLIVIPILLAGMLGGALWAGVVALLRDRFNASEILVSLMRVYVANMLLSYRATATRPSRLQLPADRHVTRSADG